MSKRGVIFCHGLFSSKDGYKITSMAEHIVNAGYTLLTFDFSFVGESEGDISELSILQEVEDLRCAFSFFQEYGIDTFHLIGSSMGGVVSLLFSSEKGTEIKTQILIATPVIFSDLKLTQNNFDNIDSIPDDGMTSIDGVPVHNRFFKEIMRLDMNKTLCGISAPTLVIHGGRDMVVDVANAHYTEERLSSRKKLVIIEDGDHNLKRDSDLQTLKRDILE